MRSGTKRDLARGMGRLTCRILYTTALGLGSLIGFLDPALGPRTSRCVRRNLFGTCYWATAETLNKSPLVSTPSAHVVRLKGARARNRGAALGA